MTTLLIEQLTAKIARMKQTRAQKMVDAEKANIRACRLEREAMELAGEIETMERQIAEAKAIESERSPRVEVVAVLDVGHRRVGGT